ncbi:family 4 glycosylhydrolase [Tetragenococcus muriaticus 3MR10-3]|uniref:Family 4 glycosylhydrolase n=1 Tax=Tetragenococcus muriaticus 3MR10-3 TaxID=1302648 RepID=A0A091CC81_9ENTE|nr:family 4 glycosylhydrolase [Tetragenococcus muriaticus 3MR10-3]
MKKEHLQVVIAGGGSTYTPGIVQAMISSREQFPFSSLILYDIDESRNDDMFEIINYMLKKKN